MIEKTKKWFRLLAFIPLLAGIMSVNMYFDPDDIFHDAAQFITDGLMAGNDVYFVMDSCNERANKKCFIQNMPKHVDCIAVGPSLSMGIRSEHVGTSNYYNLSASRLSYYDYMAVFGLLNYKNVKFDKVILCVDSYFFDESIIAREQGYRIWEEYAHHMEDLLNNKDKISTPENYSTFSIVYAKLTQIAQMVSPSYFKSSLKFLPKHYRAILKYMIDGKRYGIVSDETTASHAHYKPDGSWVYSLAFIQNTVDFVIKKSDSYNIPAQFGKGLHPSEPRKKMFIKLIQYLMANNVKIEFFLCSLPPVLWDRVTKGKDAQDYFMFDELEKFANDVAKEYNIKLVGSYNPYNIGIQNEDYLDARHIRNEKLEQYFDFGNF